PTGSIQLSGLGTSSASLPLLKSVVSKGASKARFSVANTTVSIMQSTYGIANFSMGFANDNSLKYVFICKVNSAKLLICKSLFQETILIFEKLPLSEGTSSLWNSVKTGAVNACRQP